MKKLIYIALVLLLTIALSGCCGFCKRSKGPCGPGGHHGPCNLEKPCCDKNPEMPCPKCAKPCHQPGQTPCEKPCHMKGHEKEAEELFK